MDQITRKIELLAPAKDIECGRAAIDCGADAIYIGASKFGARENAGNTLDDIAQLVEYAHKYWAKVYVTVNTLLRDDEIQAALDLIDELHTLGVDALIIQDTGLLECDLPPMPLIASTQMHNNTPERVAFLGKVGFKRAILARELNLDEIKAIRQSTDIELECFIHGALCVCYSGQCYMSYSLGARSGNRGQCAQPCRRTYDLVDATGRVFAQKKHLLSMKDLNLSGHLEELIQAGVSAFKIEGRLKDRAYVTNVVSQYRAELDGIIKKLGLSRTSSGTSVCDFTPDVTKTFNRGFTTGFLNGKSIQKVANVDTPKMIGEYIGTILSVQGKSIKLDRDKGIHPGDGVCFFGLNRELKGTVVNEVKGPIITLDKPHGVREHMQIFRNHDHHFGAAVENSRTRRKMSVALSVVDCEDGLIARAIDENSVTAEFHLECVLEEAQKPEQALDNIRKQMAKTGESDYECTGVDVQVSKPVFVPMSMLNALRRGVLENLTQARLSARPVETGGPVVNSEPFPTIQQTFDGNILNDKAFGFHRRHGVFEVEPAAESGTDLAGRRVMRNRYCIKHQLDMCPKYGGKAFAAPLFLVDQDGNRFKLLFDCEVCEMEVHLESRPDRKDML